MERKETRLEKLTDAISEAKRFLKRAREAREEIIACIERRASNEYRYEPIPSKKYAATKRASLDLSNALVEVRRP